MRNPFAPQPMPRNPQPAGARSGRDLVGESNHRYRAEQHEAAVQAAKEQRRGRVKKVGTIKRVGRNRYVTEGWQIDGVDYVGTVYHENDLGGFTPAELCAMAHGPNCRCTR